jgi:hypothetical protein
VCTWSQVVKKAIDTAFGLWRLDVSDETFSLAEEYSGQFGIPGDFDRRLPWHLRDSMSDRTKLQLPKYMKVISP